MAYSPALAPCTSAPNKEKKRHQGLGLYYDAIQRAGQCRNRREPACRVSAEQGHCKVQPCNGGKRRGEKKRLQRWRLGTCPDATSLLTGKVPLKRRGGMPAGCAFHKGHWTARHDGRPRASLHGGAFVGGPGKHAIAGLGQQLLRGARRQAQAGELVGGQVRQPAEHGAHKLRRVLVEPDGFEPRKLLCDENKLLLRKGDKERR